MGGKRDTEENYQKKDSQGKHAQESCSETGVGATEEGV
jgi:hypothetical protein